MSEPSQLELNKKVAQTYLIALSEMRIDDARALMHEECICELPTITLKPNLFGRDGMLEFIQSVKKAIPDGIRFEFKDMTAEDNRVSAIVNGYAKTIDGTSYNNRYHFLLAVDGGKISRHVEYFDSYLGAKVMGPILKRVMGAGA
jgi:ketosteroid isomerase-like protein